MVYFNLLKFQRMHFVLWILRREEKNQDISLANHFSGSHTHAICAYVRVQADVIFCYMSIKNRTVNISCGCVFVRELHEFSSRKQSRISCCFCFWLKSAIKHAFRLKKYKWIGLNPFLITFYWLLSKLPDSDTTIKRHCETACKNKKQKKKQIPHRNDTLFEYKHLIRCIPFMPAHLNRLKTVTTHTHKLTAQHTICTMQTRQSVHTTWCFIVLLFSALHFFKVGSDLIGWFDNDIV